MIGRWQYGGGIDSTQIERVIDIAGCKFKAVIKPQNAAVNIEGFNLSVVSMDESVKDKYYVIIPNRGTQDVEKLLKENYGMRNTADFYTLWYEK